MATSQPRKDRTTSALRAARPAAAATLLPIETSDSRVWTGLKVADSASSAFDPASTVQRLVSVLGNNTLARILGVSASQPTRWRTGKESIKPINRRRLSDLEHILDRLLMELWPDQAGEWLTSPNPQLAGAAPIDVFVLRGAIPVLQAIDALAAGSFA
jgi:uncharacterized protein (DUF2384 family)